MCTALNFAGKHYILTYKYDFTVFVCRWKATLPLPSLRVNPSTRLSGRLWFTLCSPFKNLSPYCRARNKSVVVDWDVQRWLLAQGLGPVMNAAIICWCMKKEVHHHLLNIKPWQSFHVLVTASLALGGVWGVGGRLALSLKGKVCPWPYITGFYHSPLEIGWCAVELNLYACKQYVR